MISMPANDKPHGGTGQPNEDAVDAGRPVGVAIPDEHVGAFVAQAFEDPERNTSWDEIVETFVAEDARDEWAELDPVEKLVAVLSMADDYDEKAIDLLERIPTDRDDPGPRIRRLFEEARRCRRNADALRDGAAAAYGTGVVDDEQLVRAVESFEFETERIERREDALDSVATAYGFEFRPYGGTLLSTGEENATENAACDPAEGWSQ